MGRPCQWCSAKDGPCVLHRSVEVEDMEKSELAGQVLGLISSVSELTPVPAHTPWRITVQRTDPPEIFMIDLTDDEMIEVTAGISDVLSDRLGFPPTIHKTDGY